MLRGSGGLVGGPISGPVRGPPVFIHGQVPVGSSFSSMVGCVMGMRLRGVSNVGTGMDVGGAHLVLLMVRPRGVCPVLRLVGVVILTADGAAVGSVRRCSGDVDMASAEICSGLWHPVLVRLGVVRLHEDPPASVTPITPCKVSVGGGGCERVVSPRLRVLGGCSSFCVGPAVQEGIARSELSSLFSWWRCPDSGACLGSRRVDEEDSTIGRFRPFRVLRVAKIASGP